MEKDIDLILTLFEDLTTRLDNFLSECSVIDGFKKLLQYVHDITRKCHSDMAQSIPELIVTDFDEEQIWQELEIMNRENMNECLNSIFEMLIQKDRLIIPVDHKTTTDQSRTNNKNRNEDLFVVSEESVRSVEATATLKPTQPIDTRSPSLIGDANMMAGNHGKDRFFDKKEMEVFLDREDEKALTNDGYDDDDDNDFYFVNSCFNESDFEEEPHLKYSDFFDHPDDKNKETKKLIWKEKLVDDGDQMTTDSDIEFNPSNIIKQSLERTLYPKIELFENEKLGETCWQMKGEVTGPARPLNSLLEEVIEFNVSQRPAPVITNETSLRLEDIIISRVKDAAYDDVEKRIKPVQTPKEFKNIITLDQQKSKYSLAEIYEQEYLKKQNTHNTLAGKDDIEPETHIEIRKGMKSLFLILDSLSNFHYTPKPVVPEIKIISNLPAPMMEDVAPVTASDVRLLAPEEVAKDNKTRALLIGKEERTVTDKKRERRKKKLLQTRTFQDKQKSMNNKLSELSSHDRSSFKNKKISDKLIGDTSLKSSSQFFQKLQYEVNAETKKGSIKKEKINCHIKKLKL